MIKKLVALAVCSAIGLGSAAALAEVVPENKAIREALSPLRGQDGYCTNVTSTAAEIWPSAAPARLTALSGEVRWVEVLHVDSADSSAAVCTTQGSTLGTSLTCDAAASPTTTAGMITGYEKSRVFLVQRTKRSGTTPAATPEIYARTASATVTVCVTVGF